MKCDSCKEKIVNELSVLPSVKIVDINVQEQRLIVQLDETSPGALHIQNIIETKLELSSIIRGTGNLYAAVSEIRGSQKYSSGIGVARFVQNDDNQCLLDATIDGLDDNQKYQIGIHEFGDLSDSNYHSIGKELFSLASDVEATNHKLNIKRKYENIDIFSYIGRSIAIKCNFDVIAAAVIARASKVLDNSKKVCACSGKTLWEERKDNQ